MVADVMVDFELVGVVLVLPFPAAARLAFLRLFLLPDEGGVAVLRQPVRFVFLDYSSVEDREGDSAFAGVVESGPELGVVSVPVP